MSNAYYGLFHFTLTALADEFVGRSQRASPRYVLVYRSVDHKQLRALCDEVQKQTPQKRYARFVPLGGFEAGIQAFARLADDLREKRNNADYDPQARFRTENSKALIQNAREATQSFTQAAEEHRRSLLTLLLCPPRE